MIIHMKATFHVNGKFIPVLKVDSYQENSNFINNYAPHRYVTVYIPLSTAINLPIDKVTMDFIMNGVSRMYDAYPVETPPAVITARSKVLSSEDMSMDLIEMIFQLVDPEIDKIGKKLGTIALTNSTITDAINELSTVKPIKMVKVNNIKKYKFLAVPMRKIPSIVSYLQDTYGIYNGGVGIWIDKDIDVYPLYDVANPNRKTVIIRHVERAGIKLVPDNKGEIIVDEYTFEDVEDLVLNEKGSTISTGHADSIMTRPIVKSYDPESTEITQSVTGKGHVVQGKITSNTCKLRTTVMANSMIQVSVISTNIDLTVLTPCTQIVFIMENNKVPVTYKGIIAISTISYKEDGNPLGQLTLLLDGRTKAKNSVTKIS